MNYAGRRHLVGRVVVGLSLVITSFRALWGIIWDFREGWYSESLLSCLGLMFAQYCSPALPFLVATVSAIRRPGVGAAVRVIFALLVVLSRTQQHSDVSRHLIANRDRRALLVWSPRPRNLALALAFGLPAFILIVSGLEPAIRVAQRVDDGNLQARRLLGNGVELVWAPDGPG